MWTTIGNLLVQTIPWIIEIVESRNDPPPQRVQSTPTPHSPSTTKLASEQKLNLATALATTVLNSYPNQTVSAEQLKAIQQAITATVTLQNAFGEPEPPKPQTH